MKKEMLKKLKAVILSVFMLGVVLFQCADALPVMAANGSGQNDLFSQIQEKTGVILQDGDVYIYYKVVNSDSENYYCSAYRSSDPIGLNYFFDFHFLWYSESKKRVGCYAFLNNVSNTDFSGVMGASHGSSLYKSNGNFSYFNGFKVNYNSTNYDSSACSDWFSFSQSSKIILLSSNARIVSLAYLDSDNNLILSDGIRTGHTGSLKNNFYDSSKDETGGSSDNKESFEKNNTYTRDLGYLKDVRYKLLSIKGADDSGKVKFSYSDISSSGFNVKQESVSIRLYSQLACYNRKGDDLLSNMPVNYVGSYEASPLTFSVLRNDIYAVNDDLWNQVNTTEFHTKAILKGYNRSDRIFLQIVQKNSDGTFNYGGYTVLTCTYNSTGDAVVSVSTRTPDGGRDMDYSYTDKFSPTEGTGSSYEDAEENADNTKTNNPFDALFQGFDSFMSGFDGIVQVFQSFKNALFEIISYFGDFPTLIAKTFPFLPSFITTSISVGFLLAVVLRFLGRQ